MNVSGIFKILIIVVCCVVVGAIIIKILVPNAMDLTIGWVETSIHSATGANFDLNNDGKVGKPKTLATEKDTDKPSDTQVNGYSGFTTDADK